MPLALTGLAPLLLAQSPDPAMDDFAPGLAFFALAMFGLLAVLLLAAAGIGGALVGGAAAAAFMVVIFALACVALLTAVIHLILAVFVWTRRPPTRVFLHKRWWALATLFTGLFAAIPFFGLHYRPGRLPRCFQCGYSRIGLPRQTRCPECAA